MHQRLAYLLYAESPCSDNIQHASVYTCTQYVSHETLHQAMLELAACDCQSAACRVPCIRLDFRAPAPMQLELAFGSLQRKFVAGVNS